MTRSVVPVSREALLNPAARGGELVGRMKYSATVGFNGHRGFVMPIRRLAADKALTRVSARKRSIPQRPSTHLRFLLYSFRHVAPPPRFSFQHEGIFPRLSGLV